MSDAIVVENSATDMPGTVLTSSVARARAPTMTEYVRTAPSVARKRRSTLAGMGLGFISASRVSNTLDVAPSAK